MYVLLVVYTGMYAQQYLYSYGAALVLALLVAWCCVVATSDDLSAPVGFLPTILLDLVNIAWKSESFCVHGAWYMGSSVDHVSVLACMVLFSIGFHRSLYVLKAESRPAISDTWAWHTTVPGTYVIGVDLYVLLAFGWIGQTMKMHQT